MIGIGAYCFLPQTEPLFGLLFRFKAKTHINANAIRISLNGMDLYNVEFLRVKSLNSQNPDIKVVESFGDVYAEDLPELFENTTGLYLTLGIRRQIA